jgi:hypothetical protein
MSQKRYWPSVRTGLTIQLASWEAKSFSAKGEDVAGLFTCRHANKKWNLKVFFASYFRIDDVDSTFRLDGQGGIVNDTEQSCHGMTKFFRVPTRDSGKTREMEEMHC